MRKEELRGKRGDAKEELFLSLCTRSRVIPCEGHVAGAREMIEREKDLKK